MPIYEYKCDDCGEEFEVFQKVSDPPPAEHSCGSHRVSRLLSRSSFVLKGGGWYSDGYASGGSASTASTPKTESKAESSTPAAPAAAPSSDK